jgi:hypothetical protein
VHGIVDLRAMWAAIRSQRTDDLRQWLHLIQCTCIVIFDFEKVVVIVAMAIGVGMLERGSGRQFPACPPIVALLYRTGPNDVRQNLSGRKDSLYRSSNSGL